MAPNASNWQKIDIKNWFSRFGKYSTLFFQMTKPLNNTAKFLKLNEITCNFASHVCGKMKNRKISFSSI